MFTSSIDLHIHSSHSLDGEVSPARLAAMAAESGIKTIAIADHNRTSAVAEAAAAGAALGLTVIPAVEVDCRLGEIDLHLLGYFIDPSDRRYADLWRHIEGLEQAAAERRLEAVRNLGVTIPGDKVRAMAPDNVVTGELLAEIALAEPANANLDVLEPYREDGVRSDNPYVNFYWDYCARGKPAFVEIVSMTLAEAVDLVRRTGGVPILAHPGVNLAGRVDTLSDILAEGVAGLEAYSGYHSPDQAVFWHDQARRHRVAVTCGSDFHGKTKPAIPLGGHGGAGRETGVVEKLRALRPV